MKCMVKLNWQDINGIYGKLCHYKLGGIVR